MPRAADAMRWCHSLHRSEHGAECLLRGAVDRRQTQLVVASSGGECTAQGAIDVLGGMCLGCTRAPGRTRPRSGSARMAVPATPARFKFSRRETPPRRDMVSYLAIDRGMEAVRR